MKKNKLTTKQKMIALTVILFILSLYVSVAIPTAIWGRYENTGAFRSMLRYVGEHGFPTTFFLVMIGLCAIVELLSYMKLRHDEKGMDIRGRAFRMSQTRQSYGDSHFETPEEYEDLAIVQNVDHAYGTILGQLDLSGKHLINSRIDAKNRANSHIAVVGASGTGKTYTFSKNFIYQTVKRRESIIITDPDGGLYADTAGYFMDHGYVVRRLDLNKLTRSDGWDCLKSIMGEDVELNAQLFAQVVISNVAGDKGGIYVDGPMALLKALILRVALDHGKDFPPEAKNIESVYSMLQNPGGEEYLDSMFNAEELTEEEMPCLGPYLTFKQGSPNLRGNLITNLSSQLQLFQNKTVCKVLSTDDIDLVLPAQTTCAYYCIFPDSHDTFKFLVSLFFSLLFIKLIAFADDQPERKCPIPVNFLLDEFPSIGKLPDFDKKMATIRKRALNVVMIFQDITQLQHNYEDTWVTLLSNCATFLSLGINDQYTSDMVTKRIGDTTIEAKTEQHASTMADLFTIYRPNSTGEGKRALLSYDELFKLDKDESIILFQNHNPILAMKYPHINHPESKKLRPIDPTKIPSIFNVEAREKLREEEKVRVEKYLKEHPLSEVDRSYAGCCEPEPEQTFIDKLKDDVSIRLKAYMDKASGFEEKYSDDMDKQPGVDDASDDADSIEEYDEVVEVEEEETIEAHSSGEPQETADTPKEETPCRKEDEEKPSAIPQKEEQKGVNIQSSSSLDTDLFGDDDVGSGTAVKAPVSVPVTVPSVGDEDDEHSPFDTTYEKDAPIKQISEDDDDEESYTSGVESVEDAPDAPWERPSSNPNTASQKPVEAPVTPPKTTAPTTAPVKAAAPTTAPAKKAAAPTTQGKDASKVPDDMNLKRVEFSDLDPLIVTIKSDYSYTPSKKTSFTNPKQKTVTPSGKPMPSNPGNLPPAKKVRTAEE